MRQRKSCEKDAFTTVIESLSTTTSDTESQDDNNDLDAPFPRDEARVTILSEIEKRLIQFPHKLLTPSTSGAPDTALVLYRSPESFGLPKSERQKHEDMKSAIRKRIMEKRRAEKVVVNNEEEVSDGYEADAEDFEDFASPRPQANGLLQDKGLHQGVNQLNRFGMGDEDDDEDDGDMMDLD